MRKWRVSAYLLSVGRFLWGGGINCIEWRGVYTVCRIPYHGWKKDSPWGLLVPSRWRWKLGRRWSVSMKVSCRNLALSWRHRSIKNLSALECHLNSEPEPCKYLLQLGSCVFTKCTCQCSSCGHWSLLSFVSLSCKGTPERSRFMEWAATAF